MAALCLSQSISTTTQQSTILFFFNRKEKQRERNKAVCFIGILSFELAVISIQLFRIRMRKFLFSFRLNDCSWTLVALFIVKTYTHPIKPVGYGSFFVFFFEITLFSIRMSIRIRMSCFY